MIQQPKEILLVRSNTMCGYSTLGLCLLGIFPGLPIRHLLLRIQEAGVCVLLADANKKKQRTSNIKASLLHGII